MMPKTFTAADCPNHVRHRSERTQGPLTDTHYAHYAATEWLYNEGFVPVPKEDRDDFNGKPEYLRIEIPQHRHVGARIDEDEGRGVVTVQVWGDD